MERGSAMSKIHSLNMRPNMIRTPFVFLFGRISFYRSARSVQCDFRDSIPIPGENMSILHTRAPDAPLTALRAFVAVGRHGSFTRAADSLGITQSAVSRHISTLETFADCRLFVRRGSTIEFTPPGLQLFEAVKDALSTIELTMQLLAQRGQRHDRLKVRTSLPSFAMTVVIPSLGA